MHQRDGKQMEAQSVSTCNWICTLVLPEIDLAGAASRRACKLEGAKFVRRAVERVCITVRRKMHGGKHSSSGGGRLPRIAYVS